MKVYILSIDEETQYGGSVPHVFGVYSSEFKALEAAAVREALRVHPIPINNYTVTDCEIDSPASDTLLF